MRVERKTDGPVFLISSRIPADISLQTVPATYTFHVPGGVGRRDRFPSKPNQPAMAISFACSCGKSFRAKDELAGKRTKCPACGQVLVIPSSQVSEPPGGTGEL